MSNMSNIVIAPLIIAVVLCFVFKKKRQTDHIPKIVLLMVTIYTILTIDLGVNFASSLNVEYNDGISVNGILSPLVFVRDGFSIIKFREAYHKSMYCLIISLAIYMYFVFRKKEK